MLAFGYNNDETINGVGVGVPPKAETDPVGPCIVGAIDLRDSDTLTKGMIIEEGSIPGVLSPILPAALSGAWGGGSLGLEYNRPNTIVSDGEIVFTAFPRARSSRQVQIQKPSRGGYIGH